MSWFFIGLMVFGITIFFLWLLFSQKNYIPTKENNEDYTITSEAKMSYSPLNTNDVNYKDYDNGRVAEGVVRRTLEYIYKVPFKSCNPNILKNPKSKRNLEFDCFNHKLGIAAEYNGPQHYIFPNFWHKKDYNKFLKQLSYDKFKRKKAKENNIYFIEVPYTLQLNEIPPYILSVLPDCLLSKPRNEIILPKYI